MKMFHVDILGDVMDYNQAVRASPYSLITAAKLPMGESRKLFQ